MRGCLRHRHSITDNKKGGFPHRMVMEAHAFLFGCEVVEITLNQNDRCSLISGTGG